jgi:hypothetical protein
MKSLIAVPFLIGSLPILGSVAIGYNYLKSKKDSKYLYWGGLTASAFVGWSLSTILYAKYAESVAKSVILGSEEPTFYCKKCGDDSCCIDCCELLHSAESFSAEYKTQINELLDNLYNVADNYEHEPCDCPYEDVKMESMSDADFKIHLDKCHLPYLKNKYYDTIKKIRPILKRQGDIDSEMSVWLSHPLDGGGQEANWEVKAFCEQFPLDFDAESFALEDADDYVFCEGCKEERLSNENFTIDNGREDVLDDGNVLCDRCHIQGYKMEYDAEGKYIKPYDGKHGIDFKRGNDGKFRRRLSVPLKKDAENTVVKPSMNNKMRHSSRDWGWTQPAIVNWMKYMKTDISQQFSQLIRFDYMACADTIDSQGYDTGADNDDCWSSYPTMQRTPEVYSLPSSPLCLRRMQQDYYESDGHYFTDDAIIFYNGINDDRPSNDFEKIEILFVYQCAMIPQSDGQIRPRRHNHDHELKMDAESWRRRIRDGGGQFIQTPSLVSPLEDSTNEGGLGGLSNHHLKILKSYRDGGGQLMGWQDEDTESKMFPNPLNFGNMIQSMNLGMQIEGKLGSINKWLRDNPPSAL